MTLSNSDFPLIQSVVGTLLAKLPEEQQARIETDEVVNETFVRVADQLARTEAAIRNRAGWVVIAARSHARAAIKVALGFVETRPQLGDPAVHNAGQRWYSSPTFTDAQLVLEDTADDVTSIN